MRGRGVRSSGFRNFTGKLLLFAEDLLALTFCAFISAAATIGMPSIRIIGAVLFLNRQRADRIHRSANFQRKFYPLKFFYKSGQNVKPASGEQKLYSVLRFK